MIKTLTGILLLSALALGSCGRSRPEGPVHNAHTFPRTATVTPAAAGPADMPPVREAAIAAGKLFCLTGADDACLLAFPGADIDAVPDTAGAIGQGPSEWIMPAIFTAVPDSLAVYDTGRNTFTTLGADLVPRTRRCAIDDRLRHVKAIDWPVVGYVRSTADSVALMIADIASGAIIDSISFPSTPRDHFEFQWSTTGSQLVIASVLTDEIFIYSLDSDHRPQLRLTLVGDSDLGRSHYTDVDCAPDRFYVLNASAVDFSTRDGSTVIEAYNYDGESLAAINTGVCATLFQPLPGGREGLLVAPSSDRPLRIPLK